MINNNDDDYSIFRELKERDQYKRQVIEALSKNPIIYTAHHWAKDVLGLNLDGAKIREIDEKLRSICKEENIRIFGKSVPNPAFFNVYPEWLLLREEELFEGEN